jgi:Ni,Fe-hydrogenase III small subunit/ferredoxin
MLNLLKIRFNQGSQFIPDIKKAEIHKQFRGLPVLNDSLCDKKCGLCKDICPTGAISVNPLKIDLGKCVFCGDCERVCSRRLSEASPNGSIKFSNFHKTATTSREYLIVDESKTAENYLKNAIYARKEIHKFFGRSLKLRQVSAGGCNGCELELNACSNVNFDMGRFGVEFVASPRHADGIVITGPITENMASALLDTYKSVPDPKIIIAVGSCAISGGVFVESNALKRDFFDKYEVDLYMSGCPVHPLTFINGVLDFIGR